MVVEAASIRWPRRSFKPRSDQTACRRTESRAMARSIEILWSDAVGGSALSRTAPGANLVRPPLPSSVSGVCVYQRRITKVRQRGSPFASAVPALARGPRPALPAHARPALGTPLARTRIREHVC